MTIVASVKVRDGLILGTDSMTQIATGTEVLKTYSNARKLFRVGETPIGVMTYGLGNVGKRSIESLVLDFSRRSDARAVRDVAQGLFAHIGEHYEAELAAVPREQRPLLGFFIAGYSDDEAFPEEWEFAFPRDDAPFEARPIDEFGASWRGIDAPITRVLKGFDPYVLPERLAAKGLSEDDINEVFAASGLETPIMLEGMPVQDAINFCVYVLDTTIGWSTFALGAPACGRPLQVATILADTGFGWVARPRLSVQAQA